MRTVAERQITRDQHAPRQKVTKNATLFFRDLPAPAQYLCFRSSGFRFSNVASAIVKQRQTCPPDLIVRAKLDSLLTGINGLVETSEFHSRHTECVPPIEKIARNLNTPPVRCHC